MSNPKYTLDYFINKFTNIPEENWCSGDLEKGDMKCVMGHCGVQVEKGNYVSSKESEALFELVKDLFPKEHFPNPKPTDLYQINDGNYSCFRTSNSPRQRILDALNQIKKK